MRIRKNQLKTENPKSQQTCRHLPPKESRLEPKRTYMGHCGDWDGGDGPRVRKSRKLEPISSGKPFVQVQTTRTGPRRVEDGVRTTNKKGVEEGVRTTNRRGMEKGVRTTDRRGAEEGVRTTNKRRVEEGIRTLIRSEWRRESKRQIRGEQKRKLVIPKRLY